MDDTPAAATARRRDRPHLRTEGRVQRLTNSSGWIRTSDLTIMSRALGCEPRRCAAPQAQEILEFVGYPERAACACLTGVVLWRRRVVDADAAGSMTGPFPWRVCWGRAPGCGRNGRGFDTSRSALRVDPGASDWSLYARLTAAVGGGRGRPQQYAAIGVRQRSPGCTRRLARGRARPHRFHRRRHRIPDAGDLNPRVETGLATLSRLPYRKGICCAAGPFAPAG
jgi:hypothetical protein